MIRKHTDRTDRAPTCPDGDPQRLHRALGFRERSSCEPELRVPLADGEHGACCIVVDEHDDEVGVRVLACFDADDESGDAQSAGEAVWPVRVWLEDAAR